MNKIRSNHLGSINSTCPNNYPILTEVIIQQNFIKQNPEHHSYPNTLSKQSQNIKREPSLVIGRLEPVTQRLVSGYPGRIPLGVKGNNLGVKSGNGGVGLHIDNLIPFVIPLVWF